MSGWFDEATPEGAGEAQGEGNDARGGGAPGADRSDDAGRSQDAGRTQDAGGEEADGGARERYRVKGDDLLGKVKQIVREGNVRKITIRNEADEVLLSFPLAAGVLGAALLPLWAAIGAVAALVGNCSIEVERRE